MTPYDELLYFCEWCSKAFRLATGCDAPEASHTAPHDGHGCGNPCRDCAAHPGEQHHPGCCLAVCGGDEFTDQALLCRVRPMQSRQQDDVAGLEDAGHRSALDLARVRRRSVTRPYDTHRWRQIRPVVLQRDEHQCQIRLPGCKIHANEVDHIIDWRHGGAWFDIANLRAACKACNIAQRNTRHAARNRKPTKRRQSREW